MKVVRVTDDSYEGKTLVLSEASRTEFLFIETSLELRDIESEESVTEGGRISVTVSSKSPEDREFLGLFLGL